MYDAFSSFRCLSMRSNFALPRSATVSHQLKPYAPAAMQMGSSHGPVGQTEHQTHEVRWRRRRCTQGSAHFS